MVELNFINTSITILIRRDSARLKKCCLVLYHAADSIKLLLTYL